MTDPKPTLKRSLGLAALIFYGVGTMVGGGFYALIGKVVGEAGAFAPLALAGSGLLALINAFAFAELSARYPVSAGEARYVEEGLGGVRLSTATGALVVLTGVVSAAALATATSGFVQDLFPINHTLGVVLVVLGLGAVAAWGMGESAALVAIITVAEVSALLVVVAAGAGDVVASGGPDFNNLPISGLAVAGVFSGAFLGFYAFIGFEDMVNIAEEVKEPHRTLPIAILASVVVTTLLYIAVGLVAVCTLDVERLSESRTPIAELMGRSGLLGRQVIGVISVLAGINGALVQLIMATRVCYGLADRGRLPAWMGVIHPRTRTPLATTVAVTLVTLGFAVALPLTQLAELTSAVILVVFALVNLALWRLKGRDPAPDGPGPRYPRWLPLVGFTTCLVVLLTQAVLALLSAL